MNDQRKMLAAAVALCVQQGMQPNEESIKRVIPQLQQLGPEQFNQLATMGEQLLQQAEQKQKSAKVAALGTKLDYINKLKGICPEGTEKVYLAKGGCMCKQKAKEGTKVEEKKTNEIQKFKSARFGSTLDEKKKTSMPTKYDEKKHERLAIGEAMGKNNKAQQDSLKTYRTLFNKQSDQTKYNMGDQKAGFKLKNKKACGGLMKKKK